MAQTSREIVTRTVNFDYPERVARDLWVLPWFSERYSEVLKQLMEEYPVDFTFAENVYNPSSKVKSDPYSEGIFVDAWGCEFVNIQPGIIGEVREPIIKDIKDWNYVTPPYEILPDDPGRARDQVNASCQLTNKFVLGTCVPEISGESELPKSYFNFARPWERYQFLRGTENAMMDLVDFNEDCQALLKLIHDYYLKEMEFWVSTDIDAVWFMDDWGGQKQLLIPPKTWREIFKPLYKDYCDLAHSKGKLVFMHSDGYILDIYEDLIEIGVNAINSQIFCMGLETLSAKFKGRITFWGEIDRQHILPHPDPKEGQKAVREIIKWLHDPSGGIIAQCEAGPGANPETVLSVCSEWNKFD